LSKFQSRRVTSKGQARRSNPAIGAYPSFVGLKPATRESSNAKKANTSRGTKQEVFLRRVLCQAGLRFKTNVAALPGKPDIVFPKERIVVFCDGDFWHGHRWSILRRSLKNGSNAAYWTAKILRNIKRDGAVSAQLKKMGWKVIRIWESDILTDADNVRAKIERFL
jgi:DNA mismatch endonuclease (patch repair protein)